MDEEIQRLLAKIQSEQEAWEESASLPASTEAIEALQAFARERLGHEVPPGYIEFLRECDGLDFNGHTIYAARQRTDPDGETMLGFAEANDRFRATDLPRHHVLYGETGDELLAFDDASEEYAILDRGSLSVIEACGSFEKLLSTALARALQ